MSDRWLSLFLFLCIIYIAPWMLGFAGWYDTQPYRDYLFYIPFQHLYFIGPVIFFYLQNLLNPSFRFSKKDWLHFIPGILYIIYSLVIVITDKLVLDKYYFLADGADRDFDTWYQVTGFISMIFYFIAGIRYYNKYKKMVVQVVSYADAVLFRWVSNFLLAFLIILVVRSVFFVLDFFIDLKYWDVWWYFLSFSILFYYIAITGYANSVTSRVSFHFNIFSNKTPLMLNYTSSAGTTEEVEIIEVLTVQPTEEPLLKELKEKIIIAVEQDKIYENPELTLPDLAKKVQTNVSVLSKAINRGFDMNFNDLINFYRVQAVIEKLKAGEQKKQTLLGIAFDCGFNSKATFNRAFKKLTSHSPKDWMKQNGI